MKYTLTIDDCEADDVRTLLNAYDAHSALRDVDNMCRGRIKYAEDTTEREREFLQEIRSAVCEALGDLW